MKSHQLGAGRLKVKRSRLKALNQQFNCEARLDVPRPVVPENDSDRQHNDSIGFGVVLGLIVALAAFAVGLLAWLLVMHVAGGAMRPWL